MSNKSRILIIDDDAFLANIYLVKLEDAGFDPYLAMTASEAVEQVKKQKPDVIISESAVSGTDGFGIIDRIEEEGGLPLSETNFIFLTGENTRDRISEAESRGVKFNLFKNEHTFDEVVEKIRALV